MKINDVIIENTETEVPVEIEEQAPPGQEEWINKRKPEFKSRYGKDWQKVLYSTAWKRHKNEGVEQGQESNTLKAAHAEGEAQDAALKAKGFGGSGSRVKAATFGPNEEYPLPWRVVGSSGEPHTIYSGNNKTVASWLRRDKAEAIVDEVSGQKLEEDGFNAVSLKDLMKDIDHVNALWAEASVDGDVDHEEAAIASDQVASTIEHLSSYLQREPGMKTHPMVQRIYKDAQQSGIISHDEVPGDITEDGAGGRQATMKTKPEGYLKGQKFVG